MAHTEPISKDVCIIKVIDMFRLKNILKTNAIMPYFDVMKPVLPRIVNMYEIRKPSFHLLKYVM